MKTTQEILEKARAASVAITCLATPEKDRALSCMAREILCAEKEILAANAADLADAAGKISDVMMDRLRLDETRLKGMAAGIEKVTELRDPVGRILNTVEKGGMKIRKISVPLGVVAIIYESRPNVTSDAAALAIKSGNACILRTGKEAFRSAFAIASAMRRGLEKAGIPADAIQLIEDTTRASANELMTATGFIDLLIPRGGKGLIDACLKNATVPCIQTGTGICHIYTEKSCKFEMALDIIENAKTSRPSVCNAAEVMLVDRAIAPQFLPLLYKRLVTEREKENRIPVELRLEDEGLGIIPGRKAEKEDFDTEFLGYTLAVKIVENCDEAIGHIARHSTHHSEAVITENEAVAARFTALVDSAAVYLNASTRFTDGGEFGLGCEMGISTQKLHARGPMGLEELTTYKYIITGNGNIR